MGPLDYKSQYIRLQVDISQRLSNITATCDRNTSFVNIHKYLSGISNLSEKNRVVSIMRRYGYNATDRLAVAKAFNGKASVVQCRKAVAALIDLHIPEGNLQTYCDTYFGLDCSGFINCYFQANHGLAASNIASYYQRGSGRLRMEFSDFRNYDVLIWCDSGGEVNGRGGNGAQHIAIINRVKQRCAENMQATVVESTGTVGLVHSDYSFNKTATHGVFRVHRPLKPTTPNHVKVVPVIF